MIGRDSQLEEVVSLLGGSMDPRVDSTIGNEMMYGTSYPVIVIHGYNSTGKSTCVRLALQHTSHGTFAAFVDCTTVYSSRQVFTDILRQVIIQLILL